MKLHLCATQTTLAEIEAMLPELSLKFVTLDFDPKTRISDLNALDELLATNGDTVELLNHTGDLLAYSPARMKQVCCAIPPSVRALFVA
jgi:hypothetical protein